MKSIHGIALLLLLLVSHQTQAQVYRCQMPNGGTQFSDTPCPTSAIKAERHMGSHATTSDWVPDGYRLQEQLDSANRAAAIRRAQVYGDPGAQSPQEASGPAVLGEDPRASGARAQAWRDATTVMPGAQGLTRSQRNAAAEMARTPQERDVIRREASRLMPGARGLTASQLDAQRRMLAVEQGRPLPPPAPFEPPPPPPPVAETPGPTQMVNCDPAGCWDTSGRRHSVAAGGFSRADGKFCTATGAPGQVICN